MPNRHLALTPEALQMMDAIARNGSFAGAARELGRVPSALTYSVRQLEEALDVLLFDRRSGQARMTPAGQELLAEGRRLLAEMQGVANRVQRVATGWETELTVAVDDVLSREIIHELVQEFCQPSHDEPPPTRLRLRTEVLAGTWEALQSGQADLALGVSPNTVGAAAGFETQPLGSLSFVFALSPRHPLAAHKGPIGDEELVRHRAVAVADSAFRLSPVTVNLLPGQDVLTVASKEDKREALIRGLGCGFLPEPFIRSAVRDGHLVTRPVRRPEVVVQLAYAWRAAGAGTIGLGLALQWWLQRLQSPATRQALLDAHGAR